MTQPPSPTVFDATDADFQDSVLKLSMQTPVIVDFWAPWCGPCQTLGPVLEDLANNAEGAWVLAKVNTDENPMIAQAMRIRSLPTVVAFIDGQPVDAFQGALPAPAIQEWLGRFIDTTPKVDPAEAGIEALNAGELTKAAALFAQALQGDPKNVTATRGNVQLLLRAKRFDDAKAILDQIPEAEREPFKGEFNALKFRAKAADAPPRAELEATLNTSPYDLDALYNLAMIQAAEGQWDDALQHLLNIVIVNREWRDELGRTAMIEIFETLGLQDETTIRWRKKLGRAMY